MKNGSSTLSIAPWQYLLLGLAALVFLAPGISSLPPIDRDEARFVQASKQMLETGDFIDIRFQDDHRYKKPVGIYWLQTAVVTLTGGDANSEIWRYRLVSVAAGVASVVLLALLGSRMFGPQAGLAAGILLAGMFGLAFEGRIAKTDATLLAVTLLAQTALAHVYLAAKDRVALNKVWPIVFWAAIGVGILIKGPLTLAVAGLTVVGLAIFDKDRSWLKTLRPFPGVVLVMAIAAPWLIAITLKSDGAFWAESVGKDMLGKVAEGQESHWGPPGYYMLTYSLYFWPFGYLALVGGLKALGQWRDPRFLFCFAWYIPFWLILEFVPTKLPHYPLPVYPALLLLAAWALVGAGQKIELLNWQKWLSWLAAFGVVVVTLVFVVIAIGGGIWSNGQLNAFGFLAAALAIAATWFALGFRKPEWTLPRLFIPCALAALFYAVAFVAVLPNINSIWLSRNIAEAILAIEGCEKPDLASVDFHEPSLVFLVGTQTKLTDVAGSAAHLQTKGPCAFALIPGDKTAELQSMLASGQRLETVQAFEGLNYSNGQSALLNLLRLAK